MDPQHVTKTYSTDEVTVLWQSHLCIHSGICFRGLPLVFDPRRRPWVILENADAQHIRHQVEHCPSGALSIVE